MLIFDFLTCLQQTTYAPMEVFLYRLPPVVRCHLQSAQSATIVPLRDCVVVAKTYVSVGNNG